MEAKSNKRFFHLHHRKYSVVSAEPTANHGMDDRDAHTP